jgi:hypothetical protein
MHTNSKEINLTHLNNGTQKLCATSLKMWSFLVFFGITAILFKESSLYLQSIPTMMLALLDMKNTFESYLVNVPNKKLNPKASTPASIHYVVYCPQLTKQSYVAFDDSNSIEHTVQIRRDRKQFLRYSRNRRGTRVTTYILTNRDGSTNYNELNKWQEVYNLFFVSIKTQTSLSFWWPLLFTQSKNDSIFTIEPNDIVIVSDKQCEEIVANSNTVKPTIAILDKSIQYVKNISSSRQSEYVDQVSVAAVTTISEPVLVISTRNKKDESSTAIDVEIVILPYLMIIQSCKIYLQNAKMTTTKSDFYPNFAGDVLGTAIDIRSFIQSIAESSKIIDDQSTWIEYYSFLHPGNVIIDQYWT